MITVVLVIHLLLALTLVGLILIQRSEGGGLGMGGGGGGGGGMGGFMTGRDASNMLTRATGIVAAGFFITSLALAILAGGNRESGSLLDQKQPATEAPAPEPAAPAGPVVPVK